MLGSQYINKCEMMYESANVLQNKCLYVSVPHCAYYSAFQLISYIWFHKMGKTESDISNRRVGRGSHEEMINAVKSYISGKNNADGRAFNTNVLQLKKIRASADYDDVLVDCKRGNQAMQLAENVNTILRKYAS